MKYNVADSWTKENEKTAFRMLAKHALYAYLAYIQSRESEEMRVWHCAPYIDLYFHTLREAILPIYQKYHPHDPSTPSEDTLCGWIGDCLERLEEDGEWTRWKNDADIPYLNKDWRVVHKFLTNLRQSKLGRLARFKEG